MWPAPPAAQRPWDVVGVGATSVDFVYVLPACPAPAPTLAKLPILDHYVSCGGQMATALTTCARLGLRTTLVSVIGSDGNGDRVLEELETQGVDVGSVVRRSAPNGYAVILIDERTGERFVLWSRDDRLRFAEGEPSADLVRAARVVHVDDVDIEAAIRIARAARSEGVAVTSDIEQVGERTPELVAAVTFPIFAEHVPAALTGLSDPDDALRALRRTFDSVLTVTLGARGAMALDGDHLHHAPASPVEPVDTTGAGDVFRGAFVYAYLQGMDLPAMLRFGNAAAAVSCGRRGAMASAPSLEEVEAMLARGR